MSKKNFIIWSYEDGPIRVENTSTLLKTYTHRSKPAEGGLGNLTFCHCWHGYRFWKRRRDKE
jgi:hypothetical protein